MHIIGPLSRKRLQLLISHILSGKIVEEVIELSHRMKEVTLHSVEASENSEYKPLVSIVVPTRNEAVFLSVLLKSLKLSTYKKLEVIVVDYNSTDGTREIAERYGAKVLNADKPGIGYARHLGSLEARGDIIIQVDADTVFPPLLIANTIKFFFNNPKTMLYHTAYLYYDGSLIENILAHYYNKYWRDIWETVGQFIAYRRELYETVQFDPSKAMHEDFDFGYKVFKTLGKTAISFDFNNIVLVSARKIRRKGLTRYLIDYLKT